MHRSEHRFTHGRARGRTECRARGRTECRARVVTRWSLLLIVGRRHDAGAGFVS